MGVYKPVGTFRRYAFHNSLEADNPKLMQQVAQINFPSSVLCHEIDLVDTTAGQLHEAIRTNKQPLRDFNNPTFPTWSNPALIGCWG